MVVDDEPIVGKRLKRLLEKDGYDVEVFTRGSIAVKELEKKPFDIIITDLKMGRVDGIGIMEAARQRNPDTKVIIITGLSKAEIANEAVKKGAFGFIMKPFRIEDVRQIVKNAETELMKDRE
jgi:DNA-binding NtrC family response regulator